MKKALLIGAVLLVTLVSTVTAEQKYDYTASCDTGAKICCTLNKQGGYDCTLYGADGDKVYTFRSGAEHVVYTNGMIVINDGDGGYYYVHDYRKNLLLKCRAIETENGAPFAFESMDGLWGTLDEEGNVAVPATFESLEALNAPAQTFAEEHGLRIFQSVTGRLGLMDAQGNILLEAEYECITPPVVRQDGSVRVNLRKNGLWGWYGTDGMAECRFLHESNEMFAGYSLAVEYVNGGVEGQLYTADSREESQLCSADGTAVYRFDDAQIFSDARIAVRSGKTSQLLNADLEVIFETDLNIEALYGDMVLVSDENYMRGLLNAQDGSVVVPVAYDSISELHEDRALTVDAENVSVIDANGAVLYSQAKADPDNDDQGAVLENGYIVLKTPAETGEDALYRYTILDPGLNTVCTFDGVWMDDYKNGALSYYSESRDEDVMIDVTTGEELLSAKTISLLESGDHAKVCLTDYGKWTLFNTDGTRFLQGTYGSVDDVDPYGLICVRLNDTDEYVFMNTEEKTVLQNDWTWAYGFDENGYGVVNGESYIDLNGEIVGPYLESDDVWF